ncbi:hypothetical protein D3C80_2192060 [compost metagenome]
MARKCTKISSPESREMKPKPLEVLNHFTVPVSRLSPPLLVVGVNFTVFRWLAIR